MRKFTLAVLSLIATSIVAQTSSTIGTNAGAAGISTNPINRQNVFYSVSEYLWTKAQLNAAGINSTANLTGIQFEKIGGSTSTTNNSTNNTPNVKVYIQSVPTTTTTLSGASWTTNGFTEVFSGQYTHSGAYGWKAMTFGSSFFWDNNSNIKVIVTQESNVSLNSTDRPSWRYGQYTTAANGDLASQCRFGTTSSSGGGLPTGISLTGNKAFVRFNYSAASCTPPSNPSFSSGPTTLCAGATATYTASATNGTSTSYAIQSGGANINSSTGAVSNVASNFTVRATITNACGTVTVDRAVTVNASPSASISPATVTICSGNSATITASGGNTYSWSNGLGTGASKTVSPSANTTYTVTVTDANNCTATASRLVTVNALPNAVITPATSSICAGGSATLSASGGNTFAWDNGLGAGASKTVSPTANTTYTVTVTDANNCTATASRLVTVNALPNAVITPATSSICAGGSATLTASGGNTYNWDNGLGSGASKTVSPNTNTTYTVTVTDANNCTATASREVTVNPSPSASVSPSSAAICSGGSATFTASGGTNYNWSNALGSGATKTASPVTTTTYTVTVSDAENCTATATVTITVNQPSASSLNNSICTGGSFFFNNQNLTQAGVYFDTLTNAVGCDSLITLNLSVNSFASSSINATICQGQNYTFNNQTLTQSGVYFDTLSTTTGCDSIVTLTLNVGSASASSVTQAICSGNSFDFNGQTYSQTGTYTATLSNASGCDSVVTLNLTVSNTIQNNITQSICSGESFLFDGQQLTQGGTYTANYTGSGGCDSTVILNLSVNSLPQPAIIQNGNNLSTGSFSSYQWFLNGQPLQGATTNSIVATQSGNYTVEVADGNGCSASSSAFNFTSVGIEKVDANWDVRIYPNPASSLLTVETNFSDIVTYTIEDVSGRKVQHGEFLSVGLLDVSTLAQGLYFLVVKVENSPLTKKILKR